MPNLRHQRSNDRIADLPYRSRNQVTAVHRWIDSALLVVGMSVLTLLRMSDNSRVDQLPTRWITVALLVYGGWSCSRSFAMVVSLTAISIWCWIEASGNPNWTGFTFGQMIRFVVATWLVWWANGIRAALIRAHDAARLDSLTGLPNRRAITEALDAELSRLRRFGRPFTLVMLDCDGFKGINDDQGHASGDHVLRLIGKALRQNTRRYDCIGRLGGDEFVLVLPEADSSAAELIVERLRAALRHEVERQFPSLTFSVGVVTFHSGDLELDECLGRADTAMYAAKKSGKDQTRFEIVESLARPAIAVTPK